MFYLKSKYFMVAPSSSDFKLIFPLILNKFLYDRTNFSEEKCSNKLTTEIFSKMLDEIEREFLFFRTLIIFKLISIFSLVSLLVFNLMGVAIIVYDAVKNSQKTENEFSKLTGDPDKHLLQTQGSEITELTAIGISILVFGVLQFIIVLIVIDILSKKTFENYKYQLAKIFDNYNKNIFKNNEIKMIQGERCMWLEMRLDFKYNQYLDNHQKSWEQIVFMNNENIIKTSDMNTNKNLLEKNSDK